MSDASARRLRELGDVRVDKLRHIGEKRAAALESMGYRIREQTPWGAVALIAVGPVAAPKTAESSGNDAALSGATRPGWFYGANDPRRPAGAAIGY